MTDRTLYVRPGCPYCLKVKRVLDELDLDYEEVSVPMRHGDRTEVKEISGQTGVPVIVDPDGGVDGMAESDDIVAYLRETYAAEA